MPYDEGEEESVSQMRRSGVPKEFSRWAISYLSGSGYDYQAVDIQSHYDDSLTFQENKAMFKQMYPSQPGEKYAKSMTHAEMQKAQYDTYAANVQMAKEEKEAERQKKREFAEEQIEKSTKVKRDGEDAVSSDELTETMESEPERKDFLGKVGDFLEERKQAKEIKKKEEQFKTAQTQKELEQKLALAKARKGIREAEREVKREDIEETKYRMTGGATGEMLLSGMDFLGKRQPQQPQKTQFLERRRDDAQSELRRNLDVSYRESPRATGQPARTSLRQNLDILARPAQGQQQRADRFGLNVFGSQQQQPKQKYKYRIVVEKGVARRERVPIPPDPNAPPQPPQQGVSMLASMDIFNTPRRMQQNGSPSRRFDLAGPSLGSFSPSKGKGIQFQQKRDFGTPKRTFTTKPKAGLLLSKINLNFLGKKKVRKKAKRRKKK